MKKSLDIKKIFEKYDVFYNALLSCTALSNDYSNEYEKDATKILKLVCRAYDCESLLPHFSEAIFNELGQVTTVNDSAAVKKNEGVIDCSDEDVLLYLKATVIEALHNISLNMNFGPYQDRDCFDYTHLKPYQENMRFSKINSLASCGIVIATRQAAIMQMLGIGCEKDLSAAHRRLVNCAYWGDIFSIYLLADLYLQIGETEKHDNCLNVAKLCDKYLHTGCTVLPDEEKEKYGSAACDDYALISTILQDVIYANNLLRIDFSFIEAINSPDLDYYKRMRFINEYRAREWQEITNSSISPDKKIGFR